MRHVLNLVALAVILLGVAMIETNGNQWGLAVISVAVVFWLMPLLRLVHKNAVVAVVFWSGVAYFSWQVAVVALWRLLFFLPQLQSSAFQILLLLKSNGL